jgi:hypothetical protein
VARLCAVAGDGRHHSNFSENVRPSVMKTRRWRLSQGSGKDFPDWCIHDLAYIDAVSRPAAARGLRASFYSDLMVPHEVAHQWWAA